MLVVKNPPANAEDARVSGWIPGSGGSPRGGNGNPLQYSCLGKSHGQRSLVAYSSWGYREADMSEYLAQAKQDVGTWQKHQSSYVQMLYPTLSTSMYYF